MEPNHSKRPISERVDGTHLKIGSQIWHPKKGQYYTNYKSVVNILLIKGSLYQERPFKGSKLQPQKGHLLV